MKKMSKLFKLNWKDLLKGLALAVGTPLLYYVKELIPSLTNLNPAVIIALSAFVAYLIKNFVTDENGRILGIGGGGIMNPPKK